MGEGEKQPNNWPGVREQGRESHVKPWRQSELIYSRDTVRQFPVGQFSSLASSASGQKGLGLLLALRLLWQPESKCVLRVKE